MLKDHGEGGLLRMLAEALGHTWPAGRSLLGLPGDTWHTLACACRGVPLTMRSASGACGANGARRFQEANIVSFRNARLYMSDQIEGFV